MNRLALIGRELRIMRLHAGRGPPQGGVSKSMTMSAEMMDERVTVSLSAWDEWKERCALGLCCERVRSDLTRFAGRQGKRFVFRYAHRIGAPSTLPPPPPEDMWHLFETHLTVRDNRQGKKYKEWLFARSSGDDENRCQAVNGGAALLLRDVVREYLRREYSPVDFVSTSAVLEDGNETLTIEDLLPGAIDTADEVAAREFDALASGIARDFVQEMPESDRLMFLAKDLAIPSTNPLVTEMVGCGKSMLSERYRKTVFRIAESLKARYADEDSCTVRILVVATLEAVKRRIREWASKEPSCAALLQLGENR